MGLGKTIQAISVAYIFKQEWPLLIVVPSSLKYPWIEELEKWIPELDPRDINLVESKTDTMYDNFKFNRVHHLGSEVTIIFIFSIEKFILSVNTLSDLYLYLNIK